jgi:hypothetical protein
MRIRITEAIYFEWQLEISDGRLTNKSRERAKVAPFNQIAKALKRWRTFAQPRPITLFDAAPVLFPAGPGQPSLD